MSNVRGAIGNERKRMTMIMRHLRGSQDQEDEKLDFSLFSQTFSQSWAGSSKTMVIKEIQNI